MAGLLRNFFHKEKDDNDGDNAEYSIAVEYSGPPVDYDIPRAFPVDVNQLPVATAVASASLSNSVTLPVIQPIVKSTPSNKKLSKEPKLGSEPALSSGTDGFIYSNVISCKQPNKADDLGAFKCADVENPSPKVGSSSSARLGPRNWDECTLPSSDGIGSSRRLPLHYGCDSSHGLSRSLELSELPNDQKEDIRENFQNYMDPTNCDSRESDLSSRTISSQIFSCKEEDTIEEAPSHVRRPSAVTFCDPESNDVVQNESDLSEAESSVTVRQMAIRPGKKGTCYRCLKGNSFSEKEVCIVCGAKYCIHCVMRAMGSMPEGRKCITCIGQRIDETKRKTLGRSSRMLRKLLSESEVKQKMNSEKFCGVNQLPPESVFVNHQPLSQDELYQLQNCKNPPKKLQPGHYWYDKVSGYWGKDGKKPSQIICSQLNIGGQIRQEASNGNTNILINNRVITKSELLMLKLAGVKYEGASSLWVSDDGSYTEEGMNQVRGNIWEKPKLCAVFFLPTPPGSIRTNGEENGVVPGNLQQKTLKKFLLVGNKNSGTSTIYKQVKE
uniref:Uncharacterized protein MANES_15G146000 n=1 Tax=Rhizophora mucronata TaxID=61149 RepID=A0A2P2IZ61_RHIMU